MMRAGTATPEAVSVAISSSKIITPTAAVLRGVRTFDSKKEILLVIVNGETELVIELPMWCRKRRVNDFRSQPRAMKLQIKQINYADKCKVIPRD